jgi:hypothetical protein
VVSAVRRTRPGVVARDRLVLGQHPCSRTRPRSTRMVSSSPILR